MAQQLTNQLAPTGAPNTKRFNNWLAFAVLGICFLAVDTASASLVTINSVKDVVKVLDGSAGVNGKVEGNTLTGNTVLIGDNNYISILFSSYDNTGLQSDWTHAFPVTAGIGGEVSGTSEVNFTALQELGWSSFGESDVSTLSVNHDVSFKLVDNTTNTVLVDSSTGALSGTSFDNFFGNSGSDTGGPLLQAGHNFTWTSHFKTSQWQLGNDLAGQASAQLVFSTSTVPEPTSAMLFGIGLGAFGMIRRRKQLVK